MESHRNNNNNNNNNQRGARPSVGYLLFQYQSELARRHAEPTRLSRTKINIIDGLVSRTIRQLRHCSVEELQACKRELVYKEQLRNELRCQRRRKTVTSNVIPISSTSTAPARAPQPPPVAAPPRIKLPSTPPKPGSKKSKPNVSIYGPEIFV